jgi:hypothetical protein
MPRKTITWQQRGEYLAGCFGMASKAFAAGIDAAMARDPQGTAGKSTAGARPTAGAKTSKARRAAAKVPAGATTGG